MVQQITECMSSPASDRVKLSSPPRSAICLPPPWGNVIVYFTSNHESSVFCAWRITCVIVPGDTPESIRHHVADLIGIGMQAKVLLCDAGS